MTLEINQECRAILSLYEHGKVQFTISYFWVLYPLVSASSNQSFSVVVSFDSENTPSLSVEVMVSASCDVLLVYPMQ